MASTAEQMRAWTGPALLTYGFRPFFLFAGLWAGLAMALWVPMLAGHLELPTAFDPVSWHAHELLFGYLGAVVAGFLLTAVPNWTGRLPIVGWPLAGLAGLWLAGRLAVFFSAALSPLVVALIDLSCLIVLAAVIAREIVAGQNWRNLIVLAMLLVLTIGNGVFHWEAASGAYAAQGLGLRIGLAAGIMMITVIGGRIVPSFTRNWLVREGDPARPSAVGPFDKAAILLTLFVLFAWVVMPERAVTGGGLILAGLVQAVRLGRWAGWRTGTEPLVWILHVGYGFVPLGSLAIGASILLPDWLQLAAAQHLWMAGAIGVMTVAVMTRATLGHTGRALTAGKGTGAVYLALILSVFGRMLAGFLPDMAAGLYSLAGGLWLLAFLGFAILYGPLLLLPKPVR